MIENTIIHKVQSISDPEKGGDNALDGFEFQVSAAIYLIFTELKKSNAFALLYEKVEDFIIFTDEINLYQAKSIGNNLTPKILYKGKNDSLSIIEKMQNNYNIIKNQVSGIKVKNKLVLCENRKFSNALIKNTDIESDEKVLEFNELDEKVKSEIVENTNGKHYVWDDMSAVRLIPKSRHEEVTRVYIEDVVNELFGENKINSLALYNSLTNEIRRIRKNKIILDNHLVLNQMQKCVVFSDKLKYNEYTYMLNDYDKQNILIAHNFNNYQNYIKIKNHPSIEDYDYIKSYYNRHKFSNVYEIFDSIKDDSNFINLFIRLREEEIKAIIMLIIAKEMN